MRSRSAISHPHRMKRAPGGGEEPRGAVSGGAGWSGPSRRAKLIAVTLSALIAVVIFTLVSRTWSHAAPPPKGPPPVEVKLIATPLPTAAH